MHGYAFAWRLVKSHSALPEPFRRGSIRPTTAETRYIEQLMISLLIPTMLAAAGYSLIYLLLGGGLGGAFLIFVAAKMLGK